MTHPIYTIGYEGVTVDALVRTLQANGVERLIDVRAVPLSRKPGFSKNKLAGRLAESGILYAGLKGLGTPAEGRAAARRGQKSELVRIYGEHLKSPDAISDMAESVRIAQEKPACLLCFEHSPGCCHRLLVAEEMAARTGQKIVHLDPSVGDFI